MKRNILTCLLLHSCFFLCAQISSTDSLAISAVKQRQQKSWNRQDWNSFSQDFTTDGTLINFVGQFWKGRADILSHLRELGDCCLSPTSIKFDVQSIRFLSPEIAIVYTEETLIAKQDYSVPFRKYIKGDTDYKMLTDVFVKENGYWKITAAQLTLMNQQVAPHKQIETP